VDKDKIEKLLQAMGADKIKASGGNVICTCPFHAEKMPSFGVEINDGGPSRWNCFGCGKSGQTEFGLVAAYKAATGTDLSEYAKKPRRFVETKYDPSIRTGAYRVGNWAKQGTATFDVGEFERFIRDGIPQYAVERGITREQAAKWRLGFDSGQQRLWIPVFDSKGVMVGWSGRSILIDAKVPKYMHAPGFDKESYLYGEEFLCTEQKVAHLSEGFFDVWAMDRAGVKNCFAFMGAGVGAGQLFKLAKWAKKVFLYPHNDKPDEKTGKRAGDEIAEKWRTALRSLGISVYVLHVPQTRKDIGDCSPEEIREIITQGN
jgi:DNA primase